MFQQKSVSLGCPTILQRDEMNSALNIQTLFTTWCSRFFARNPLDIFSNCLIWYPSFLIDIRSSFPNFANRRERNLSVLQEKKFHSKSNIVFIISGGGFSCMGYWKVWIFLVKIRQGNLQNCQEELSHLFFRSTVSPGRSWFSSVTGILQVDSCFSKAWQTQTSWW